LFAINVPITMFYKQEKYYCPYVRDNKTGLKG
jgi:hypothetical protein